MRQLLAVDAPGPLRYLLGVAVMLAGVVSAAPWLLLLLLPPASAAAAAARCTAPSSRLLLCVQVLPLAYAFLKRKGPANLKPLRT